MSESLAGLEEAHAINRAIDLAYGNVFSTLADPATVKLSDIIEAQKPLTEIFEAAYERERAAAGLGGTDNGGADT